MVPTLDALLENWLLDAIDCPASGLFLKCSDLRAGQPHRRNPVAPDERKDIVVGARIP
jgi:hypothetical protein